MSFRGLYEGTWVYLQGLSSNGALLNGARGIVMGRIDHGRYPVQIVTPPAAAAAKPHGVKVRAGNLRVLEDDDVGGLTTDMPDVQHFDLNVAARSQHEGAAYRDDPVWVVGALVKALDEDQYPPDEGTEAIFGVRLTAGHPCKAPVATWPVGVVMYSAWASLYTGYMQLKLVDMGINEDGHDLSDSYDLAQGVTAAFKGEIVQALRAGRLPAWFEAQVRALMASLRFPDHLQALGPSNTYFKDLARRGFGTINYDTRRLQSFAKGA